MSDTKMKVAVIHDWLPLIAGAERVLEQILQVFPGADVYTLFDFLDDDQRKIFGDSKITTSYLNKWPKVHKYYRKLLPFCPLAIEDFDLSEYDLIVSSSHAVAKGVITGAEQIHISYVHSPTRYAWDLMHQYLRESNMNKGLKGYVAKRLLHNFRIWDYRTANGVDYFIANSDYIRKRIWKVYRREAEVIYPPVNIDLFEYADKKEDFFLTASRMVPYKRLDLIAAAFAKLPDQKLKIIGDGPEMAKIKAIAENAPNIELMGFQATDVLRDHMQRAKAFVFAAEEDFGIIPVEAQACGTPVIAYGAGGALETVIDYETTPKTATGTFFDTQTPDCLADAVKRFNGFYDDIKFENCRKNAEKFAPSVFREKLKNAVEKGIKGRS
tara:strand:- start:39108 stop:40256 length:1149 start_codon:yes stop_codon:yes gene_type:complete